MEQENKKSIDLLPLEISSPEIETSGGKTEVLSSWTKFILGLADWKSFLTFTFRNEVNPSAEIADRYFKWWIKILNKELLGKHYIKKVGHSYFSYCKGMEYTKRDVVHFHAVIDKPIDFKMAHRLWQSRCGFMKIEPIDDLLASVNYTVKYAVKDGEIDFWKAKFENFIPEVLPSWWIDAGLLSRAGSSCQLAKPLTGNILKKNGSAQEKLFSFS